MSITYEAESIARDSLQQGEQRVLLLCCLYSSCLCLGSLLCCVASAAQLQLSLSRLLCLYGVSLSRCCVGFLSSATISEALVELYKVGLYLLVVVGLPELQVCRTLQQLTHTLRLADTRHLDHQSSFLAFQLLDVGLYDTELVDTVAYNIVGVLDGCCHLLAEHTLHFLVGALCAYLALQLLSGEDSSQLTSI